MKFFAPFRLSENISETPEGYLLCLGVGIGRTGEMVYGVGEVPIPPGPDGKVVVSRAAEELFRPETIASFEGKPVTILHPQDFVAPNNWAMLTKGIVQNVRRGKGEQENDLVADLLITDSEGISLVKAGLREVSCGYEAEYTQTGVGRGVQTNIIGNHLALVEEGRAGSAYAINDHKGKSSMKTIQEKIKAIFAKAQDEAMDAAGCKDMNTETPQTKEGFVTLKDMKGYFDEKFEAMGKKKDEPAKDAVGSQQDPQTGKPAEVEAKDDESEVLALLKKLDARITALEGASTGDAEEEEETGDEEGEEEEVGDDAEEAEGMTGDAARVEILAPGMKADQKNVRLKALIAAYGTTDGKEVIHQFTGGKPIEGKAAQHTIDALFVGVSEVLKTKRTGDLGGARRRVRDEFLSASETPKGAKTAEDLNAINAKHYGTEINRR